MRVPVVNVAKLFDSDPVVDSRLERMDEPVDDTERVDTAWHRRLEEALDSIDTQGCRCGLHSGMTRKDLRALNAGCTSPPPPSMAPGHVCPVLLKLRIRLGVQ